MVGQMSELNTKIEKLKKEIDSFIPEVVMNDRDKAAAKLPALAGVMTDVIPTIIGAYDSLPELESYKDDQQYWAQQLERILGAVQNGDYFLLYDALVNELKANLIELQKLI